MNAKEMYKQAYSDRRNRKVTYDQFLAKWSVTPQQIIVSENAVKSFVQRKHDVKIWNNGLRSRKFETLRREYALENWY